MNRTLFSILYAIVVMIAFESAAAAQAKSIVAGRFRIRSPNGNYYQGKKTIVFSQAGGKRKIYHVGKDDSGYFSFRLPHGFNSLTGIGYFSGGHFGLTLPTDYAVIKLQNAGQVYYIGDIVFNWDIMVKKAGLAQAPDGTLYVTGVGSALRNNAALYDQKDTRSPFQISSNPATIAHFAQATGVPDSGVNVSLMYLFKGF